MNIKNTLNRIKFLFWQIISHDCNKSQVPITNHDQFTWYCGKCGTPE